MNRGTKHGVLILMASMLALTSEANAQITSDFQDGTTQGWERGGGAPALSAAADSGPRGPGDFALSVMTDGSVAGGKLVVYNTTTWAGDWTAAGRTAVEFRILNDSGTTLSLRIAVDGPGGRFASGAASVPSAGTWQDVHIDTASGDFTAVDGGTNVVTTFAGVTTVRILHNPLADWRGVDIVGTFLFDDISDTTLGGYCGDGTTDTGEDCDDGPATGSTACGCQFGCTLGAAGTACGASPVGPCDAQDTCDGTGSCNSNVAVAGTVCRAAVGPCDVAETCSGGATICPANAFEADGTSCADGATCNGAEVCASGVCQSGVPVDCDDADACTMDACVEPGGTCTLTPVSGCCMTDTDCDDGDACTLDVCESTTTNMCAFMMMPGCPDAGAGDGGTGDGGAEDGGVGDGGVGDGGVGDGGVGDGGRADAGDGGDAEAGDGGLAGDASEADAMPVDTGTDPGDDGGCGCRAAPRSSAPSFWLLGFVALSWARRRRRGIRRRSNPPKPSVG